LEDGSVLILRIEGSGREYRYVDALCGGGGGRRENERFELI